MTPSTTRRAALLLGTTTLGALLVSPVGAEAARLVTGKEIKNGSITSKDVKDRSLRARDFQTGQLPVGPTGPTGPAGPAGPAAPQPTTVRFQGTYTADGTGTDEGVVVSTSTIPAFSQVAGVDVVAGPALVAACPQYTLVATVGDLQEFSLVGATLIGDDGDQPTFVGDVVTTGPAATPITTQLVCEAADGAASPLPSTTFEVIYTLTAQTRTPSSTVSGSVQEDQDTAAQLRSSLPEGLVNR